MNQRKLVYCLCMLLLTLSQGSFAQKDILVGIKGGVSIPDLTSGSTDNPLSSGWSSRFGANFGAVASAKIKGKFSIQVELNYSSQGGKKDGAQAVPVSYFTNTPPPGTPALLYATLNNVTRLNYLELPVLAKLSFSLSSNLKFFVDAGPYVAMLMNAKTLANGNTEFYTDAQETQPVAQTYGQSFAINVNQSITDDIKEFNVGIQGGIGLQQKLYRGYLMLTVGGNYGFIPIQKDASDGKNNTGAATATIGYLIKI